MGWKALLFSGKGRIGRKGFWIGWLALSATAAMLRLLGPLGALFSLAGIYPQLCLYAKRLHDIGQTGWRILLPLGLVLAAAVLAGIGKALGDSPAVLIPVLPSIALSISALVIFLRVTLAKGDPGENAYGSPPGGALPGPQPAPSAGNA